jgi:hypothetical protein
MMAVMLLKLLFFFSFDISCRFFLDQERRNLTASSSSPSSLLIKPPISNGNLRHPIKPRTMAQVPIPTEESSLLNLSLDLSSDGDITIVEKRKICEVFFFFC